MEDLSLSLSFIHTHTLSFTHTYTHSHPHTHTHTLSHTHTHIVVAATSAIGFLNRRKKTDGTETELWAGDGYLECKARAIASIYTVCMCVCVCVCVSEWVSVCFKRESAMAFPPSLTLALSHRSLKGEKNRRQLVGTSALTQTHVIHSAENFETKTKTFSSVSVSVSQIVTENFSWIVPRLSMKRFQWQLSKKRRAVCCFYLRRYCPEQSVSVFKKILPQLYSHLSQLDAVEEGEREGTNTHTLS